MTFAHSMQALDTLVFSCYTHRIRSISVSSNLLLEVYANCFEDGFKGWGKMILKDGWKCVPLLSVQNRN